MSGGSEGSGPKKPTPIIDLKATEVKQPDPAKPADPRPTAATSIADKPAPAAAKPGDKPGDKAAAKPAEPKPAVAAPTASGGAPASKPQPQSTPGPARKGGGIGAVATHLFAGVAGGFLALLGADTIAPQLGLPGAGASLGDMQRRIAAVEEAAKARPAVPPDLAQKLAAAEQRLARVEDTSRALPQLTDAQAKLAAESKSLAERIAKPGPGADAEKLAQLEQRLGALSAAADSDPQKGRIPQLAQITGKLVDLETALNTQMATVRKTVTQDVDSRLGQATEAAEQARAGVQRIDRDLGTVKTQAAQISQRLETLDQSMRTARDDTAGLKSAVDGLKNDLASQLKTVARPQDVSSALAPLNSKLATVEQSLAGVVKGDDDRKANAERIVLSLELANLKRALDRGSAYTAELAAVQKVAGDKLDLKPLQAAKDTGVPTLASLQAAYREVAYAIIAADSDQGDGSVVDRLMSSARSIVRVRKSNPEAGDNSAEAVAARIDAALKAGRPNDVLAEAKKLSPKAQNAAAAWLAKVEARAAVDRVVAEVESQLKTALAGKS